MQLSLAHSLAPHSDVAYQVFASGVNGSFNLLMAVCMRKVPYIYIAYCLKASSWSIFSWS